MRAATKALLGMCLVHRELVRVYSGELASNDNEMIHERPGRYKYRIARVNQAGREGI